MFLGRPANKVQASLSTAHRVNASDTESLLTVAHEVVETPSASAAVRNKTDFRTVFMERLTPEFSGRWERRVGKA